MAMGIGNGSAHATTAHGQCADAGMRFPFASIDLPVQYQLNHSFRQESTMVKAIATRGQIRPVEPLPADWQE